MMKIKTGTRLDAISDKGQVFEYHDRTKHRFEGYARGPEFLDWDLQPTPFRYFEGADKITLPMDFSNLRCRYDELYSPHTHPVDPVPITFESVGNLLGLSLGLSAYKEYMGDKWALRVNPSSGNLHPTEAYVVCQSISGINDGVYHYLCEDHSLQHRMIPQKSDSEDFSTTLLIALTSINWREAWKYGERAFRYCQLDTGHAIAAINYACACLGWRAELEPQWSVSEIASLCGSDRAENFTNAEREDVELILNIRQRNQKPNHNDKNQFLKWAANGKWVGHANRLDKHPFYRWPVISQIEHATRVMTEENAKILEHDLPPARISECDSTAKKIIYKRRSAQHFDKQTTMEQKAFFAILDKALFRPDYLPWNLLPCVMPYALIVYLHRVDDIQPGLYILLGSDNQKKQFQDIMTSKFVWEKPSPCPDHLPFYLLADEPMEKISKSLSCHQSIASDGVFSSSILMEFNDSVNKQAANYRKLHWQAGILGQLLYLEAESIGLQGTGIGCFFDDGIHSLLGLNDNTYQVLYNFTVGSALNDSRITTQVAYPQFQINL